MPRKTSSGRSVRSIVRRFNEAAARCRGKHLPQHLDPLERLAASMRPRPDAAENRICEVAGDEWSPALQ